MTRNARRIWDHLIELLVAVRLGQELGTDSELAQTIAHGVDFLIQTVARFVS